MFVLRRRAILAGATAAVLGAPAIANAQADWPKGPIKFLVPFPPGGSTDPIARIIQAKIIEQTGWNIVVENKPGGNGVVGAAIAAKAEPGKIAIGSLGSSLANMMPHVRAGKLKLVGVTGETRSKLAPDTPTLAQQGVKALPSFSWWGVYAPTGTPKPIIDKMQAAIPKAVRTDDVTQKFVDQFDMEVVLNSPEAFGAYIKKEQELWGKVIKDNKLTAG